MITVKSTFEAIDEETNKMTGRITIEGFGLTKTERNSINQKAIDYAQSLLDASDKE